MKRVTLVAESTHNLETVVTSVTENKRLQIARYAAWLNTQARRHNLTSTSREIDEYAEDAGRTVLIGKREVSIFAPFRPEHSALWVLTRWQITALVVLVLGWCAGLEFFPQQTLLVVMTFTIGLYLSHLLVNTGL